MDAKLIVHVFVNVNLSFIFQINVVPELSVRKKIKKVLIIIVKRIMLFLTLDCNYSLNIGLVRCIALEGHNDGL